MNDYNNIVNFYSKRLYQYISLSLAQDFFKEKDEHKMYEHLLEATMAMYEAKDMFDSFDDKDIYILCDNRNPFIIIELKDYEQ
jgi:hypothetical protein